LKGFCPGEMIHPNLIIKRFTFIFWHFVFCAIFSNVQPTPSDFLTNPYQTKLNMKLISPTMVKAHVKNSYNSLKCDNMIENIQIHMSWHVFFFFCTNMKK
jgi:hypothetical protein